PPRPGLGLGNFRPSRTFVTCVVQRGLKPWAVMRSPFRPKILAYRLPPCVSRLCFEVKSDKLSQVAGWVVRAGDGDASCEIK
ncbi:MAG: hypothetical protein FWD31_10725, partial [Planctomycetaceae bacterium]|nr:hypothetical protein [Planctomycetaceae bacterium]